MRVTVYLRVNDSDRIPVSSVVVPHGVSAPEARHAVANVLRSLANLVDEEDTFAAIVAGLE